MPPKRATRSKGTTKTTRAAEQPAQSTTPKRARRGEDEGAAAAAGPATEENGQEDELPEYTAANAPNNFRAYLNFWNVAEGTIDEEEMVRL